MHKSYGERLTFQKLVHSMSLDRHTIAAGNRIAAAAKSATYVGNQGKASSQATHAIAGPEVLKRSTGIHLGRNVEVAPQFEHSR